MKHLLWIGVATMLLASCSRSVVNVYDYYVMNGIENRQDSAMASTSACRVLYNKQQSTSLAQFELVAYKKDTLRYLIFGSYVLGKSAKINNQQYHFTVTDLYSGISDKEQAKQQGDLSVTFAHVDLARAAQLLNELPDLKARFNAAKPAKFETMRIEYNLSKEVLLSLEKNSIKDKPLVWQVWVNGRKNVISMFELEKALKSFVVY